MPLAFNLLINLIDSFSILSCWSMDKFWGWITAIESEACEPVCSKCSIIPGKVTFSPSEIAVTSYLLPSMNLETAIWSSWFSVKYFQLQGCHIQQQIFAYFLYSFHQLKLESHIHQQIQKHHLLVSSLMLELSLKMETFL